MARHWIDVWNDGDPTTLPLAEDFVHTSPYGVMRGRDHSLATVIPMAKQNVATLMIEDVIVEGAKAVIRYTLRQPTGIDMPACDWMEFDNRQIKSVRAYYERPQPAQ